MNYFKGQKIHSSIKFKIFLYTVLVCAALFAVLLCACKKEGKEAEADPAPSYGIFTVSFESTGGSFVGEVFSNEATGRIKEPKEPVRENYEFDGWYTSADYSNAFDFDGIVNSDLTLYAKWKALFTTITFYGNGSTGGTMPVVQGNFGEVISLPENSFVRTGYTFAGWSLKSNGSVQNKDKGYYFVPDDCGEVTVLYACWQPNSYNVYFDTQGSDSQCEAVSAVYDGYLTSFKKPYKAGFKFSGFYTEKYGKGTCYYDTAMCSVCTYSVAADLTLYAYWMPDIKTISFDGNCSTFTGKVDSLSSQTLQTVNFPNNAFSRTGYTFKEWNSESDGSGESYAEGDEFFVYETDGEFRIYAIWEAVSYNVVFVDEKGNSRNDVFVYDSAQNLRVNDFEKVGHSFVGWSKSADGEIDFYDGEEVCNLLSEANASLTLYAVWQANSYNISLDTQGGIGGSDFVSVVFGEKFPQSQPPKKFGYVFNGYFSGLNGTGTMYLDGNMTAVENSDLAENCSVYAYWKPKEVKLHFAENGCSSGIVKPIQSGSLLEVQLPVCAYNKVGYNFVEWNESSDGSGASYDENSAFVMPVTESDVYLYPVWTPKSVGIQFDGNGFTGGATNTVIGYSDNNIILPDCGFERRGYDFVGWGTSATADEAVSDNYKVPASDKDLVLYALWNIHTYTINYVLNGSENSSRNPQSYTVLDSTIYLNQPKYAGYNFKGWKSESGSSANSIPAGSVGDKTFIADWTIIVYNITYILGDGGENNAANPKTYTVKDEYILENPERDGYDFEGWSEGNTIFIGSTGNKTFTAEWNETRYKIVYELNGGINGSGNPGSYVHNSDDIILTDPVRVGYNFEGWKDENGNSVAGFVAHNSNGDRFFEASWTIIVYDITYILNGGTNSSANPSTYTVEDTIELEDPTLSGFIFDGWSEGNIIEEGTTGSKTFTANWRKMQYSILYVIGEGAENAPENPSEYFVDSDDIIIHAPTRPHYNFIGWRTESQEEGEIHPSYVIKSGSAESVILFAVWEAIEYAVNYELDGGINSADNPAFVTYADTVILSEATKDGYEFIGWMLDGELITELIETEGPITLTATWQIVEYSITYDLVIDASHDNPEKYTINDQVDLNDPVCEGYEFLYWTDAEGNKIESIPLGSTGDVVLTAHWKLIEVSPPEPNPNPDPDPEI